MSKTLTVTSVERGPGRHTTIVESPWAEALKTIDGLAEAVSGPAFSTAAGLLAFALKTPRAAEAAALQAGGPMPGRFGRLGQWLRENF